MNEYSINDFRSYGELYHYQVKGAKWHKRRYQNYDGSLTPEGRIHYGVGEPRKVGSSEQVKTSAMRAIDNGAADYKTPLEKINAVTADRVEFEKVNYVDWKNGKAKDQKRIDAAADLGLKAIDKLRGPGYIDWSDFDVDPRGERAWFLWEDQTTGLPLVADLINQGYSKEQVNKMIDVVEENYRQLDQTTSDVYNYAAFEIVEGNWDDGLKTFASICDRIKNEEGSKKVAEQHQRKVTDSHKADSFADESSDQAHKDLIGKIANRMVDYDNEQYAKAITESVKKTVESLNEKKDTIKKTVKTANFMRDFEDLGRDIKGEEWLERLTNPFKRSKTEEQTSSRSRNASVSYDAMSISEKKAAYNSLQRKLERVGFDGDDLNVSSLTPEEKAVYQMLIAFSRSR